VGDSYFTRSFTKSRTILTLWYVAFCLALIALLNFGAFSAQTTSLATPAKNIGFGTTTETATLSQATVSIQGSKDEQTTVTLDSIRKRFGRTLMVVDIILIVCSVVLSYILSGYTLRPIRKTLQEQEEFAEEVSHELRTPLSVMALEVETLKRRTGPASPDTVRNLSDELERMNTLVDGLLTLVRPHNKTQRASTIETFDITAAVRGAFLQQQKVAHAKHLTYTFESHYEGAAQACKSDITQVVGILLDNAIKYTPQHGAIKVVISGAPGQKVHIVVSDTGHGIPKDDLPHIFDRFYRARRTQESGEAGLGLGLAIAYKKIALSKGTINLKSELGKGTAAHVYLPAR